MDEIKLSDDIFEQIKDFEYQKLTEEQKSLIDKLITDKELKECYKRYGLCKKCKQPKTAKGGFGTTFKAVWKDGLMYNWDYENDQWKRNGKKKVALKCLHDSQDITADFLKEIESNILVYSLGFTVRCFGITKDPTKNNFMMVMELKNDPLKRPNASELQQLIYDLWNDTHNNNVNSVIYRQVKETDDINKKLSSSMIQSSLSSTSNLLYTTHPQAVYTSKLLDFKNLPEPKNADNDDLEYSDSLKMDFTKD
ncbi:uncharacterized protein OCT59_005809 [Rhizophagus irregularis]|uniref:uncharacterized protein n=1 Tax=Rhizophagus irregularis TaxID=588596 RepID=UPI00332C5EF7|nr:hypothetical protein OCT59_005809 [Rhizophagus irregularis]